MSALCTSQTGNLRKMWQFPATCKLLGILCQPLNLTVPTSEQLEEALISPKDHINLIANLHGRLLGLAKGSSLLTKWLQVTARFVRKYADDFAPLISLMSGAATSDVAVQKSSSSDQSNLKDHRLLPGFPTEVNEYIDSFSTEMRLFTLHMVAEIVLANHDKLLSAGSLLEISHDDLRCDPLGVDAVGNIYWYFGDKERVYREPQASSYSSVVLRGYQPPPFQTTISEKLERKLSLNSHMELSKKGSDITKNASDSFEHGLKGSTSRVLAERGVQNKQLVEDIFGSANTSQDSIEILTGITATANSVNREVVVQTSSNEQKSTEHTSDTDLERKSRFRDQKKMGKQTRAKLASKTRSLNTPITRRSSSRIRKQKKRLEFEPFFEPTKPPKRPRMVENNFDDFTLRKCDEWETLSIGSDALEEIVKRFENEKDDNSASEQSLVRTLRDSILPEIMGHEIKIRRELEQKQKAEVALATKKRSTRIEEIALRRAEEARRKAEERELERQRLKHLKWHEESVVAGLVKAEKGQSRDIHHIRQLRDMQGSVVRDDDTQNSYIKTEALKGAEFPSQERGLRTRRNLRLNKTLSLSASNSESKSMDDVNLTSFRTENACQVDRKPLSSPQNEHSIGARGGSSSADKASSSNLYKAELDFIPSVNCDVTKANLDECNEGSVKNVGGVPPAICSSLTLEKDIPEEFTWDSHCDDGMPRRVLDKFFLVNSESFFDVPLESCPGEGSNTTAIGILIPPTRSPPDVQRVQIGPVEQWTIEYGQNPKLWLKSNEGWYELRTPASEYRTAFASGRRKFELCARLGILGETRRTGKLDYKDAVNLLEMNFQQMAGYGEAEILLEKRFIVRQMEEFGRKSILQSAFFKTLVSKIRAEDRKKEAATQVDKTVKRSRTDSEVEVHISEKSDKRLSRKRARYATRSSSSGGLEESLTNRRQNVPRAVSSILSSIFQAATESRELVQTKRRKLNGMVDSHE